MKENAIMDLTDPKESPDMGTIFRVTFLSSYMLLIEFLAWTLDCIMSILMAMKAFNFTKVFLLAMVLTVFFLAFGFLSLSS